MDKIRFQAEQYRDYVIAMRRHFRMNPEIGGQELHTMQRITEELKHMGLVPEVVAGTGVIAEIRGLKPGKTVAIRADIDALPINDEIEKPYKSQTQGCCHACGHDAHAAMLLGAARTISALQKELQGTVRLLFQPSEERFPGGALALIKEGALKGVAAIIGTHVWQPLKAGTMGITYGSMMASPDEFTITVQGKGGHGSMPHQTVDSLLVAAEIVLALRTIIGTNINAFEPAVLSFGIFDSGEAFNIIPDKAVLKGTVRTFDENTRDRIFDGMEKTVKGICEAAGARFTLDKVLGFPPVVNNPDVTRLLAEAGSEVLGHDNVVEIDPVMVGEDFSYYQKVVPGAFMFLGVGNEEKGLIYPHHHPKFDIDEDALIKGVEITVRTVFKLLDSKVINDMED